MGIPAHTKKMAGQPPPRQPHDLEGLLKFCMQVTANEDAPSRAVEEMDPERRRWLEDAISGMTVDVVKQLAEAIKIVGGPAAFDPEANEDDLEEIEMAFEAVEDWCGNLDMANNFHKIDGFHVLKKVLEESPHGTVARANAANCVAEMAQNNPYCQENFLLRTIQEGRSNPRLRTKACFFVSVVAAEDTRIKEEFSKMGFARQLVAMLQFEEWDLSLHEQAARALCVLLTDNTDLQKDLLNSSELNFSTLVDTKLSFLEGKGEAQDERDYFLAIQKMCSVKSSPKVEVYR